jgi:hypothetical protein
MLLYHHTVSELLPFIDKEGLLPHLPDPVLMTFGNWVVWLTKDAEASWLQHDAVYGIPVCLKVDLPRHSKKVVHYLTWMQKSHMIARFPNGTVMTSKEFVRDYIILKWESRSLTGRWYVYFGTCHAIDLRFLYLTL